MRYILCKNNASIKDLKYSFRFDMETKKKKIKIQK